MKNHYSDTWYSKFMKPISREKTLEEVEFIKELIPAGSYPFILDLCCGTGRHSEALSKNGYKIIGIDSNKSAIETAKNLNLTNVEFLENDIFNLKIKASSLDAVICMWQSFGYGDRLQNDKLLKDVFNCLRPNGLFLLDIYNKNFFAKFLGERSFDLNGKKITESKEMKDGRLIVTLTYEDSRDLDLFDWQVFSPEEIENYLKEFGFNLKEAFASFSKTTAPSSDNPRAQYLFEKQ